MKPIKSLVALAALALTCSAGLARGQEVEIRIDQLPKAVLDAALARFPGATFREAARETEDGKTTYEVAMTHDGHKKDVSFEADGTLVLVETEVAESELPAEAARAVKRKYPDAKVTRVESIAKGPALKKTPDSYELHLEGPDRKEIEVEVDAAGKILK